MSGSKNLWSYDGLLEQLTEAQEEINQLQDGNEQLQIQLSETAETLAEEKQTHLSEVSKLQSALRQMQSKLQEQTGQIVKLNSADLILKDNEKLRKDNERLIEEKDLTVKRANKMVAGCQKEYVEKFSQLERYENTVKEKEKKADDMIASQSKWIEKQAAAMSERERNYYRAEYKKQAAKLKAGYRAKVTAHETQFFGTILYSIFVTLFAAVKSEVFLADLENFFLTLWLTIQTYIGYVEQAGNWLVRFSKGISQPIAATIIYWLLYIVVEVFMIAAPLAMFYYVGRKFLIWYKEQMADNISLWTAFVTLAVSIFLGSEIRSFLPMNLILLNVVVHLIYCGVKVYIRGCRKNRE